MTPPEILDAVAAVETVGASLILVDGRPRLTGNAEAVPNDARTLLRGRSAELAGYLSSAARPSPEWALFVSKRLSLVELPAAVVDGPVFWRDNLPHYRLTPAVASAISRLVEAFKRKTSDRDKVAEADRVVAGLWAWVERHYPPHAIRAARRNPSPLPDVKPPPTCPGADEWNRRTQGAAYDRLRQEAAAGGPGRP